MAERARARPQSFSAMRGVRVYSFSPMEAKAFHGVYYEIKKKVVGVGGNIASAWASFGISVVGLYSLVKWAEWHFDQEQLKHRD